MHRKVLTEEEIDPMNATERTVFFKKAKPDQHENDQDFNISGENIVKKAIFSQTGGRPYFFRVIMSDVLPGQYQSIINIINEYKAGGINYIVELREFFSQTVGFFDTSFYEYNENILTTSPVVTAGFAGN